MEANSACGGLESEKVPAKLLLLQSMFTTLVKEIEQLPELTRNPLVDTLAVQLAGVMTHSRIYAAGLSTYRTLVSKTADGSERAIALKRFFDQFHQIRMDEMGITNDQWVPTY